MTIALRRLPSNILWSRLQGTSSLGSIFTHACLLEPARGCLDLLLPHSRWTGNLREAEEVGETLAGSQNDENPLEISLVYEIIFDNKVLREQLWTTDWCLFKSYSFLVDISRASSLWFLKGRTYPVMFYGGGSWLWGGLNACKVLYINPVRKKHDTVFPLSFLSWMFQVVPFLPSHLSESFTSQPGNQYVAGECGRDIFTPSKTLYFKVACGDTNSDQGFFHVFSCFLFLANFAPRIILRTGCPGEWAEFELRTFEALKVPRRVLCNIV